MFKFNFSRFFIVLVFLSSCSKNDSQLNFSAFYLEDINEKETIYSIAEKEFKKLESPNIGFKNGVYWFKVSVKSSLSKKQIVLDLPESNIHGITVYQSLKKIDPYHLENTHFSLLVPFSSENPVYYLRVFFENEVYFPLQIKEYKEILYQEKYSFFTNGFYYGFVLVGLLLNIFFYFSLKEETFIYYSFFLIAITLGILSYDGFLQVVLPVSLSNYTSVITHCLVTFFGFLFGYKFLNISYYLPKSNVIGFGLLFLAVVNYLLFFITKNYLFVSIADTFSFFVLLHNWIVGIIIYKKHEFAKFFVIGYSLVLFSAALFILPIDWGLNIYTTSLSSIKYGSLFEVLILTYAITYRVTILQQENEQYKLEIQQHFKKINMLNTHKNDNKAVTVQELVDEHNLSDREAEVLPLIFAGYTNQKIADELFVSLNTIKFHVRNIYKKLNIKNKKEAIDLYTQINDDV